MTDQEREVTGESALINIPPRVPHFLGVVSRWFLSSASIRSRSIHAFRCLLFGRIADCVNSPACKHNDECVTHKSPWFRTRSYGVTGSNGCSWWHSKIEGATCDLTGSGCSMVQLHLLIAVPQRQKWGLGQDASCYFHPAESASASLSVSGDQPETITDSQKLGTYVLFSAFSCLPETSRERNEAWQNRSTFSCHYSCLPLEPNWSSHEL